MGHVRRRVVNQGVLQFISVRMLSLDGLNLHAINVKLVAAR